MRVKIDHREVEKGLIFKKKYYAVDVNVEFSEEEKELIRLGRLEDVTVLESPCDATEPGADDPDIQIPRYLKVSTLLNQHPYTYHRFTPAEAKEFEHHLTEGLGMLKEVIMNQAPETESKTFEL